MLMIEHPQFGEMGVSSGQIRERCAKLAEAGLAAATGKGRFDITTWGQQYLEGGVRRRESAKTAAKSSVVVVAEDLAESPE